MMFRAIFFVTFWLVNVTVFSQTTIKGTVNDIRKKPVPGANISLKDSYDGGTADSTGVFSFETEEKGSRLLEITALNFKKYQLPINIGSDTITVAIVLKDSITELSAVVLSAGTFEASDRKRAVVILDHIDIVTTASANGEITGALKTLPGAQQVGESEGLFVRGGTAAETKFFIDGNVVNNFFYSSVPNVAQYGRFSPFIFKGTVFSTGGYSALYGQALSSAVILESIDLPEQSTGNVALSVLNISGGYQHLGKKKKISFGGNYDYTNLALAFALIKQKQDYRQVPAYHNVDANFRIKTSNTGILKYYGYFSSGKLEFITPSIDTAGFFEDFRLKNTNHYHNLSFKENLGNRWKLQTGISYSENKDKIGSKLFNATHNIFPIPRFEYKDFLINRFSKYLNGKLVIEKKLRGLSAIRFGGEYNNAWDSIFYARYTNFTQIFYSISTISEQVYAAFAESDVYLTNNLALKAGLRYEYTNLLKKSNIAPRISISYKLGEYTQASLAYGIFYQNPDRKYYPTASLTYMQATHYIAQLQKVKPGMIIRGEIFYKKYKNLIKTDFINYSEQAVNNNGYGDAKGIELFWRDKKTIKNFDYWVSYSYLDTKRDFLNFPYATEPSFAARHNGSIVTKKFVSRLKMNFNASYNFSSGRPYYRIGYDGRKFEFTDMGRVPNYHNVSFALNYLPFIGRKKSKIFDVYVLQVSNIFNIKQTYGYAYSYDGSRKEAIVPPSRMFVFIGAFISLGVDRSDEVTNNL